MSTSTVDLPFLLLLLSLPLLSATTDQCQPQFADTCFSSVAADLRKLFSVDDSEPLNITIELLQDLCISIDDSLRCTTDIIDTDCSANQGRNRFDSWNKALVNTFSEVCDQQKSLLTSIFSTVHCWNVSQFFECIENQSALSSMSDLMHVDIGQTECRILSAVFADCREAQRTQTKHFCARAETELAVELVYQLLDVFMNQSHCGFLINSSHAIRQSSVYYSIYSALCFQLFATFTLLPVSVFQR